MSDCRNGKARHANQAHKNRKDLSLIGRDQTATGVASKPEARNPFIVYDWSARCCLR